MVASHPHSPSLFNHLDPEGGKRVEWGGKPPPPFYSFTVPPVVAAVVVAVGRIVLAELDGKVGREGGGK